MLTWTYLQPQISYVNYCINDLEMLNRGYGLMDENRLKTFSGIWWKSSESLSLSLSLSVVVVCGHVDVLYNFGSVHYELYFKAILENNLIFTFIINKLF